MSTAFWTARKAATEAQILAYETAIEALAGDGVQEYSLDTGQSVQRVTKVNLSSMQTALDKLYNRYQIICQRLNGGGSVQGVPGW